MATYLNPTPPLPPNIRSQQNGGNGGIPGGPASLMLQAGQQMLAGPAQMGFDPVQLLSQKVAELSAVAMDIMQLTKVVHPPLGAFLVPIAQAGKALEQQIQELQQRALSGPAGGGDEAMANPAGTPPVAPMA